MSAMFEKLLWGLGLPAEAAGCSRVSLSGRAALTVENHRGILEYGPDLMAVRCSGFSLRILGRELELELMDAGSLTVRGCISGLELE